MSFFWLERPPVGGSILGPTSIKVSRAEARSSEEGEPRTAGQGARRTPSGRPPPPDAGGAPGDADGPTAEAEAAAAFILGARRVRADEREPLDVVPEAEAAAQAILAAGASDEDEETEAAVRAILEAGR